MSGKTFLSLIAPAIRGQFGDMFGVVNALFSGLAFAGIIYTILLQREELAAQRKELRLTRHEFKQQNEAFHEQNRTIKIQTFEVTFFNLLESLHTLGQSASYRFINSTYTGSEAFGKANLNIEERINGLTVELRGNEDQAKIFESTILRAQDLREYLRLVTILLKFIRDNFEEYAARRAFYHQVVGVRISLQELEFINKYGRFSSDVHIARMIMVFGSDVIGNFPFKI